MKLFGSGLLIVCLAPAFVHATTAMAQQASPARSGNEMRTRAIVASFSKTKHVTKERHGIRRDKYKEVHSEAVRRSNLQSLSGTYEVPDLGFLLNLQVDASGRVQGMGEEVIADGVKRAFTLSKAKVEGALLTGTKVYAGGRSEGFEGVFMNRTSYDSPNDKGYTEFGLGVTGKIVSVGGVTVDRLFYRLRR